MTGVLLGIARKARVRAPMEELRAAHVGLDTGVEGDHRGLARPGSHRRRQVTAMTLADWRAALGELGDPDVRWSDRRANLLVDGIDLPRETGALLRIGGAVLEVTGECDPCVRMEAVAPGLQAALTPGWRGGRLLRVVVAGPVAVGDRVTIEELRQEAV